MRGGVSVLLVVPPFSDLAYPALGPSILAAGCRRRGIGTSVLYASFELAASTGFDLYQRISSSSIVELRGEAIFRDAAFPGAEETAAVECPAYEGGAISDAELARCRSVVAAFVERTVEAILARAPRIVGFSSVFQQSLSSIAIARRLRQLRPDLLIVLGGSNASNPMGEALASLVDVFDHIFSGEADERFPAFCSKYLDRGELPSEKVVACESIFDLDRVATPAFDDYFEQLAPLVEQELFPASLPTFLPVETSRGCWFGVKSHCTFCGLNGLEIRYRRKSTGRCVDEFYGLAHRYGVKRFQATDNIMPHEFRNDVLPALAEREERLDIFYEVKANLRASDLDLFVRAGVVMIQPGIKSFSSNVLAHLAKGVTGLQNIRLLRDCASRQIHVSWNILTGVPGETREDYEAMISLLPHVVHLLPPSGYGRIRIDRYSPYHARPEAYGIADVRPLPAYRRLYPDGALLNDIAYHFEGSYRTELLDNTKLQLRFGRAVQRWRELWAEHKDPPLLRSMPLGNGMLLVEDTRNCAKDRFFVLTPACAALLTTLERPLRRDRVEEQARPHLETLLDRRYIVEYEGSYVSVVTTPRLGVQLRRRPSAEAMAA